MQLIHNRGLADARVSGNQNQLGPAAGCDAFERSEQDIDFGFPPVQFLWNQQPIRCVMLAQREFIDALLRLPFSDSAPQPSWRATS